MTRLTAEERADECQQSGRTRHEELARVKVSEHLEIHTFLSSRWIVKLGVLAKNIIQCRTKQIFVVEKTYFMAKEMESGLNAFVHTEPLHCAEVKLDSWTHQVIVIFVESYIDIYIFYDNHQYFVTKQACTELCQAHAQMVKPVEAITKYNCKFSAQFGHGIGWRNTKMNLAIGSNLSLEHTLFQTCPLVPWHCRSRTSL